jgi:hypothetical protein
MKDAQHQEVIDSLSPHPSVKCPKCKNVMQISLEPWRQNAGNFVRSNCPWCGREIFTCLIIVSNTSLDKLATQVGKLVSVANEDSRILVNPNQV